MTNELQKCIDNEIQKCIDKVAESCSSRLEDIQTLLDLMYKDSDASDEDLGNIYEYGLDFGYVESGTFPDQLEAYHRYQISYGGPSEEIRFYCSPPQDRTECYRIEFWYLDWFDGAPRNITDNDTAKALWEWLQQGLAQ